MRFESLINTGTSGGRRSSVLALASAAPLLVAVSSDLDNDTQPKCCHSLVKNTKIVVFDISTARNIN